MRPGRSLLAALAAGSLITAGAALAPAALAVPSAGVVINEVYGGGGNSGATLTQDYIELANRGTTSADVSGWSVQYLPASASAASTWQVTPLTGSVTTTTPYLVAEARGAGGTVELPAPDVVGTIPLSGTAGTVALVNSSTALTCKTVADCGADTSVVDLLGFGAAVVREGTPAGAPSNTTSVSRTAAADTDVNSADFAVGPTTPKAANGTTTPTGPDCTATPTPAECTPGTTTIQDVQGTGFLSPLDDTQVTRVPGIVTAVRTTGSSRGFWIQQPTPDPARPNASSGVFVFSSTASVAVGDSVLVSGTVQDYYPLSSGDTPATTSNLSITEIATPTVVKLGSGPVPPAQVITATTVPEQYAPAPAGGNVESIASVNPAATALEFWESREGMLVSVSDVRVVGPAQPQFGEVYVTTKPTQQATIRGGTYLPAYDTLPSGRLLVLPTSGTVPVADVGDVFTGVTSGPVDWNAFGGFALAATTLGTLQDNDLQPTAAKAQAADQLAVGTYNVENLSPADPQSKFDTLAAGVVGNLKNPDVVSLEEIQDNTGPTNDGVTSSTETLNRFVAAITAAGGPAYSSAVIDPVDGADGGQPGGNIRVAFLYNPARVQLVTRPGGTATTPVTVSEAADGTAQLSVSPGRVDPANTAWNSSRKPLAAEFLFNGRKTIVVANHFNSKGGDSSADGRFQPPTRSSEVQRTQQAASLNAFVDSVLAVDPRANVVLAGDFNDYEFSAPMQTLTANGSVLTDLITTLPPAQRYTYNFNGVSQVLDHIFVTKALTDVEYDVVHTNSEFSAQASDHDPQVVRVRPAAPLKPGTVRATPARVLAGTFTVVPLDGWAPRTRLTVKLDGKGTGVTVTTNAAGRATAILAIPAHTTRGTHQLVATAPDGATAGIPLTVVRLF